jgi:hypothetical protein
MDDTLRTKAVTAFKTAEYESDNSEETKAFAKSVVPELENSNWLLELGKSLEKGSEFTKTTIFKLPLGEATLSHDELRASLQASPTLNKCLSDITKKGLDDAWLVVAQSTHSLDFYVNLCLESNADNLSPDIIKAAQAALEEDRSARFKDPRYAQIEETLSTAINDEAWLADLGRAIDTDKNIAYFGLPNVNGKSFVPDLEEYIQHGSASVKRLQENLKEQGIYDVEPKFTRSTGAHDLYARLDITIAEPPPENQSWLQKIGLTAK